MKANKNGWRSLFATGAFAVALVVPAARADVKENPYEPIVERNAFGLRPPPPPPDPAASLPPPPPAANVKVTGFTSLFSKKKVLLEITPVGAGKQPLKPILEEGDRLESIEIISIDVDKNTVVIKNNGAVTNLTFEVAKSAPGPVPGQPIPGVFTPPPPQAPVTTSYVPPTPQQFTPNSAGGRGSVLVAGGSAGAPAAPAFGAGTTTFGGASAYGGGGANFGGVNNNPNAPTVTGGTDFRNVPSRTLRATDPAAQANQPPIDPAQQYINMRAQELRAKQQGTAFPPTPPIPGVPPIQ